MNEKILVIDDSPTLRKLLRFYLEKKGYFVNEAHNGEVGLQTIARELFDLIILDMNMPVMNGLDVLETLKKDKSDFSIPILILSADKEEESKAAGIAFGASYYLTKPFKPEEVVARIEDILTERRSRST